MKEDFPAACIAVCTTLVIAAATASAFAVDSAPLNCPFFAFDDAPGFMRLSSDEQAKMLAELGYHGIGYTGTRRIPEMLRALDSHGLKLVSIYTEANLDSAKPPFDPGLKTAIEQLRGRETFIWLPVMGGTPSSHALDDRAVQIIRAIADMADKSGVRVVLYPHTGFYVERTEDAVRLTKKLGRKNVGATFNLCHFLKVDKEKNLEQRLKEAMPYLMAVSINGADSGDTQRMKWRGQLIQTLDRGSFDVAQVLRVLRHSRYQGPIGLQCYDVQGDPRENFARSMSAWQKLLARVNAE